ncbi:uncharacterized protein FIBRA_08567 [Fibroporia radiculosa]|uniref:NAD(P)-binding protein n=1 Tax=Fibroporia radiculosa TaxID=599839 RepID=J4GX17_9APHY|nr:uncharacterized protein FIBRA_08567 [Fibroporia radiculosa]CCM06315.1 predicted protein [Fibroporia radiculosa]
MSVLTTPLAHSVNCQIWHAPNTRPTPAALAAFCEKYGQCPRQAYAHAANPVFYAVRVENSVSRMKFDELDALLKACYSVDMIDPRIRELVVATPSPRRRWTFDLDVATQYLWDRLDDTFDRYLDRGPSSLYILFHEEPRTRAAAERRLKKLPDRLSAGGGWTVYPMKCLEFKEKSMRWSSQISDDMDVDDDKYICLGYKGSAVGIENRWYPEQEFERMDTHIVSCGDAPPQKLKDGLYTPHPGSTAPFDTFAYDGSTGRATVFVVATVAECKMVSVSLEWLRRCDNLRSVDLVVATVPVPLEDHEMQVEIANESGDILRNASGVPSDVSGERAWLSQKDVAGGNTGIGKETVKALLERNATVYVACRNRAKAKDTIAELREKTGREAIFLELDLGSLASVRRAAEEFMSIEKELHILFNNAGVMRPPREMLTSEGYDMQFGTNVIGHFFFTELLMPVLRAGAATSPDGHSRVIITSSVAAYRYTLNWDSFKAGSARRKMSPRILYSQSKFANVVIAREIAKRYINQGVVSMSCNPGNIRTNLRRYTPAKFHRLREFFLYPASQGALTQLWAGTMPETLKYNGEYLVPWTRVGKCREEAYDDALGEKLWSWLEEQMKGR